MLKALLTTACVVLLNGCPFPATESLSSVDSRRLSVRLHCHIARAERGRGGCRGGAWIRRHNRRKF